MKTYAREEVLLLSSLISPQNGSEWLVSRPGCFTSGDAYFNSLFFPAFLSTFYLVH